MSEPLTDVEIDMYACWCQKVGMHVHESDLADLLAARDAAVRKAAPTEAADAIRAEEQRFFRTWQYPGTINDARIAVERLIGGEE